jgi:PIN domain nuclease of toxin-antitoxin system
VTARGLLLDTHTWLWLADGTAGRISRSALQRVERAGRSRQVFVSSISVWEIGMLIARKRISLAVSIDEWLAQSLAQDRLGLLALDARVALESTRLPGAVHGDPADRFLVATARMYDLHIVTGDRKILAYGDAGHVKTVAV